MCSFTSLRDCVTSRGFFRQFVKQEDGAATLEFTLLAVPLIVIVFCIVQFLMLAHATIVVKGAAHAAARSALVNKCRPFNLSEASDNILGAAVSAFQGKCSDNPEAWETAARIALLPISSSYQRDEDRCDYPEALVALLQQDAVRANLTETLENKACYAFEPENVSVEVQWETQAFGVQVTEGPPPITAIVRFRVPLLSPVRRIFGGREGTIGGAYYWPAEASVTVL